MRLGIIALVILTLSQSALADEKARWATSRYDADVKFTVVDDRSAAKWYVGECSGDIALRGDRTKIYEVDHKGSGIEEIRLVSKYEADKIYCTK
ncbi:hypothetical protein KA005_25955 [bacterium]|nr:hypothetical protein [bacterium]